MIIDTAEHSAHTVGEHPPIISHHLSDHHHISIHPKARRVRQAKIPIKTSACHKEALVAFKVLSPLLLGAKGKGCFAAAVERAYHHSNGTNPSICALVLSGSTSSLENSS